MTKSRFRMAIFILLLIVTIVVLFRHLSPFGLKAIYRINADSNLLSSQGLKSVIQLSGKKFNNVELDQDEAKIELKIPDSPVPPQKLTVDINFRSDNEFKLGAYNNRVDSYQETSLFNPILQNLNWRITTDGKTSLYQKNPKYKTIEGLVLDDKVIESDGANVATYDYQLNPSISNIQNSDKVTDISSTLRGDHTAYVAVSSNNLEIAVTKQDLNQYQGKDELEIIGYLQDDIAFYEIIKDDGETNKTGKSKDPQTLRFSSNTKPGIYKIVFRGGNDLLINNISLNQKYIVFDNLFLADNPEIYPQTENYKNNEVYTDSSEIRISLGHENQSQEIQIDNDKFLIDQKDKVINLNKSLSNIFSITDPKKNLSRISISKNDMRVSGDGLFSFDEDSFFKPFFSSVKNISSSIDLTEIDYIVAKYSNAKEENGWYHQKIEVPINPDMINNNIIKLRLSSEDNNKKSTWLKIKDLNITVD